MSLPTVTASGDGLLHLVDLGGEVDAGEEQLADLGDRAVAVCHPGLVEGPSEQAVDDGEGAVEADVVGGAERPADERDDLAVGAHEREVGLRVAAVERKDERGGGHARSSAKNRGRCSRSASSSFSVSSSTGGTWPTSGCASKAL